MTEAVSSLVGLATSIFTLADEDSVMAHVVERLPALCRSCSIERGFLLRDHQLVGWPDAAAQPADQAFLAQLKDLSGAAGAMQVAGRGWAWGLPLTGLDGFLGYLVVTAPRTVGADQRLVLGAVAALTGAAVAAALVRQPGTGGVPRHDPPQASPDTALADAKRYGLVFAALAGALAGGEGEAGIALALHQVTGLPVIVEDADGRQTAAAGAEPSPVPARPSAERITWRLAQARRHRRPVRDGDLLVAPAAPHGELLGALALVDPHRTAAGFEAFALEQAAVILAIELVQRRRLAGVQLVLERDFVDDLLAGLDDTVARRRGDPLGHDLGGPLSVLLLRWQGATGEALARAADRVVDEMKLDALSSRRDGMVVLIVALHDGEAARARWLELHRRLTAHLGATGSVGVGAVAQAPSALPRSFQEATQALSIRALSHSPFGVTAFEDLGVYRILARTESRQDVEQYVEEWLGALIEYDGTHRTDMVATVAEYCEAGGSYDHTARALGIHRSTLRYRLGRVREISGHDLNDVDARFNLHVAARAWRVLTGVS